MPVRGGPVCVGRFAKSRFTTEKVATLLVPRHGIAVVEDRYARLLVDGRRELIGQVRLDDVLVGGRERRARRIDPVERRPDELRGELRRSGG